MKKISRTAKRTGASATSARKKAFVFRSKAESIKKTPPLEALFENFQEPEKKEPAKLYWNEYAEVYLKEGSHDAYRTATMDLERRPLSPRKTKIIKLVMKNRQKKEGIRDSVVMISQAKRAEIREYLHRRSAERIFKRYGGTRKMTAQEKAMIKQDRAIAEQARKEQEAEMLAKIAEANAHKKKRRPKKWGSYKLPDLSMTSYFEKRYEAPRVA